jgi:very-short-patch-repair endonuclease
MRVLAENVVRFIETTAELRGRLASDHFSRESHSELVEGKTESPIEDLFWVAMKVQCLSVGLDFNPGIDGFSANGAPVFRHGIHVNPQAKIGDYRVDFVVCQFGVAPDDFSPVVVELDGHAFHDKNKLQRSYEKARDRSLVKGGYRVVHFTGSDVFFDAHRVAFEVLELLGATGGSGREYSSADPLGLGD